MYWILTEFWQNVNRTLMWKVRMARSLAVRTFQLRPGALSPRSCPRIVTRLPRRRPWPLRAPRPRGDDRRDLRPARQMRYGSELGDRAKVNWMSALWCSYITVFSPASDFINAHSFHYFQFYFQVLFKHSVLPTTSIQRSSQLQLCRLYDS